VITTASGGRAAVPASHAFASRHHPGDQAPPVVLARALTGPLSFAMLILMLAATASVLLGQDPLPWLAWVAPLAAFLAFAFSVNSLRSTPAELLLIGDRAALRSVWDVAAERTALPEEVTPPRRVRGGIDVGIGRTVYTLERDEWPRLDELHERLLECVPPVREDTW
jgi:hypothetical protein